MRRRRVIALVATVAICLVSAAVYAVYAMTREQRNQALPPGATTDWHIFVTKPRLIFRNTTPDAAYGRVALAARSDPGGTRALTPLTCDRVAMANGRGLCLRVDESSLARFRLDLFDADFRVVASFPQTGGPSRTQVSADGRYGAATVFVSGHSYTAQNLSTATTIYNLDTRTSLGNLETFTLRRDGAPFHPADVNLWGVTFAPDDDTFYVTLATGGVHYLARGSIRARTVDTAADGVECPSLSPDGTRIAFKASTGRPGRWQLSVMDLATRKVTPLAEKRSVDDQAAWWDDSTVMYGLPDPARPAVDNTWIVPADGSGAPRQLIPSAWSAMTVP